MRLSVIKSHAKVNLSLNITGKSKGLHKIESLVAFINFFDQILIKKIKSKTHRIVFKGRFSKNINKKNTISRLLEVLEKKKLIKDKFFITIFKNIPQKAGLGGGSMNAASILKFLIKKKIIKINNRELFKISNNIGSDVILGINKTNSVLTSKNKIREFKNCQKVYLLVVKPSFGCSTKEIYSKVKMFNKPQLRKPGIKMFNPDNLKRMENSLEKIVFNRYKSLKKVKSYLENLNKPIFVRMTGSGSALVAYYYTKKQVNKAKKKFRKDYKRYWCISSKTI